MSEDLLILGKGDSRVLHPALARSMPQAVTWTLNDVRCPGAAMHFDIHEDQRFWNLYDEIPSQWCVSPFAPVMGRGPRMAPFPLAECFRAFGHAYFECSLDYMLALALLQRLRGSHRWRRIWLTGCDMADGRHFTFRPGTSFWLGVAKGMGIELKLPPGSTLLKRVVNMPPQAHGDPEYPHAYGQLSATTAPVAARYGWER